MSLETTILIFTAASIGFIHTVFGPDHYLPFVALAKSGKWSELKMMTITFFCGVGHVLGSVVLGGVGLALGVGVQKLVSVESARGEVVAWFLILFGLTYTIYGLRQARKKKHSHSHHHSHLENTTPWVLMIIFVLGPCEPLIPLLIYPAAKGTFLGLTLVVLAFGVVTIGTMMTMVYILFKGVRLFKWEHAAIYSHALAGGTIFMCGAAIKFLGL